MTTPMEIDIGILDDQVSSGNNNNNNPKCAICQNQNYDPKQRYHRGGDTLCSFECFKTHTKAYIEKLKESQAAASKHRSLHLCQTGGVC